MTATMPEQPINRGALRRYQTSYANVLVKVLGPAKRAGDGFYRCEEMEGELRGMRFVTHEHWLHPIR